MNRTFHKIFALIALLLPAAMPLQAQEEEEMDFSFPVTSESASPTISDYVTAISCIQEAPGEHLIFVGREWKKFQAKQPYEGKFTEHTHRGYIRYEQRLDMENGEKGKSVTEFCTWKCSDKRYTLVTEVDRLYMGATYIDGQYCGISIYLYDSTTKRMEMKSPYEYGIEHPDINGPAVYRLTADGRSIILDAKNPEEGECKLRYVWNGQRFDRQVMLYKKNGK